MLLLNHNYSKDDGDDGECVAGCSDEVSGFDVLPIIDGVPLVLSYGTNSSISIACVSPQSTGFSVKSINSTPG